MRARILILIFFLLINPVMLFSQNYGVSLKISSLGINLEGVRKLNEQFNARLGVAYFSYNFSGGSNTEDYNYKANAKLFSVSVLGDWFLFESNFRITCGLLINLNNGNLTLNPIKTYTVGSVTYTPEDLGNLKAKLDFNTMAPYLGLGFGNTMDDNGLEFTIDLGTIYQGKPKVDLMATGLLSPSEEQEPIVQDNLKWFQFYPVLSIGIIYKF